MKNIGKRLTMGMLKEYIRIFTRFWNCYLDDDEEMQANIYIKANMIAIEFFPVDKGDLWDLTIKEWKYVLDRLPQSMATTIGTSKIISSDGVIVMKLPVRRLWSTGQAREDAEATLCEAIIKGVSTLD